MIIVFSYYVLLQSFLLINIFHSCSNMPQQIIFSSPKEPARYSFLAQRSSIRMKTLVQLPNLGVIRKIFINGYFTQLQQQGYATTNHLQLAKIQVLSERFLLTNILHSCSNMPQQIIFSWPKCRARYQMLAQIPSLIQEGNWRHCQEEN